MRKGVRCDGIACRCLKYYLCLFHALENCGKWTKLQQRALIEAPSKELGTEKENNDTFVRSF
jgi:hypothetical protein